MSADTLRTPGPMQPRPASAAMAWCDYLDGILEHAGEMSEQQLANTLDEEIDKIERRGLISADDAAALRVVYAPEPRLAWKCRRCGAESAEPDSALCVHPAFGSYRAPCCGPCGQYFSAEEIEAATFAE